MRIVIRTAVRQAPAEVMARFDRDLFLALKPPLLPLALLRFDGSRRGDRVHLRIGTPPFAAEWHALITADGEDEHGLYFVDEGEKLPPPLRQWRHYHGVWPRPEGGSLIVDDFNYRTPFRWLDVLFYPLLFAQFYARRPVYRRRFGAA